MSARPPQKNVGADPCVRPAALNMVGQQTRRVLRRTVKSRWGWGVREKRDQFFYSPSPLGGVPLCMTRRRPDENSGRKNGSRGRFVWKCGRTPTSKRRGRCPHRPANIVSAYVLPKAGTSRMDGRPRADSPTIRFRKRHTKGRADNICPYISAHIFQMAGRHEQKP